MPLSCSIVTKISLFTHKNNEKNSYLCVCAITPKARAHDPSRTVLLFFVLLVIQKQGEPSGCIGQGLPSTNKLSTKLDASFNNDLEVVGMETNGQD